MGKNSISQFIFGLTIMVILLLSIEQITSSNNVLFYFFVEIMLVFMLVVFSKVLLVDRGYSDRDTVFSSSIPIHMMFVSYMLFKIDEPNIIIVVSIGLVGLLFTLISCRWLIKIPLYFTGSYLNEVEPVVSPDLKFMAIYRNDTRIELRKLNHQKKYMISVPSEPTWMGFSLNGKYLFYRIFNEGRQEIYALDIAMNKKWKIVDFKRKGIKFYPSHSSVDEQLVFIRDQKVYSINIITKETEEITSISYDEIIMRKSFPLPYYDGEVIQEISNEMFLVKNANSIQLGDYRLVNDQGRVVKKLLRKTELPFESLSTGRRTEHQNAVMIKGKSHYFRNEVIVVVSDNSNEYCAFMQYFAMRGFDVVCCRDYEVAKLKLENYRRKHMLIKSVAMIDSVSYIGYDRIMLLHRKGDLEEFLRIADSIDRGIAIVKTLDMEEYSCKNPVVEYLKNPKKVIRLLREG